MFKENIAHLQGNIFSISTLLQEKKYAKLLKSKGYAFYQLVFRRIKESIFAVLYSSKGSRPNTPVNILVGALIFKSMKGWSFEELFESIDFDLQTRIALGIDNFEEDLFSYATIFNFQNRLNNYHIETGTDLLETVFNNLSRDYREKLGISTDIQRMDSSLIASNIRKGSRLWLLVEIIRRLHRVLSDEDKNRFKDIFNPYMKYSSSGQYIYCLNDDNILDRLAILGNAYHLLYEELKESEYSSMHIFELFERVFNEHFTVLDEKVEIIPNKELHSGILQSPDDDEATFREKRDKKSQGYVFNACETANPDNEINIITDITVAKNNVDDSVILNDRIDKIKEKTPDLNEFHTDGGLGSEANDEKMEELGITHIQTAIKGREAGVEILIEQVEDEQYEVSCPHQKVNSEKTKTRFKAVFNLEKCQNCPLSSKCQLTLMKQGRVYYFGHKDYLMKKRHRNIERIPLVRRKLRSNVEATMKEFKVPLGGDKLRVRGLFKARIYVFTRGISINFGRVYRLLAKCLKRCDFNAKFRSINLEKLFFLLFFHIKRKNRMIYTFLFC